MSGHDDLGGDFGGLSEDDSAAVAEALASETPDAGEAGEKPVASDDDVDALLAELTAGSGHEGPAPWQDPAVEAAMNAGPPRWLGTRWREIPADEQREALVGLRRWVDWLVAEFDLNRQIIPACWFRHSNIIAELHAAMNMEYKVWEEGAPSANPLMMWLPHLQAAEGRLRLMVENIQCGEHGHVEKPPAALDYDDGLWRETIYTHHVEREIDRPTTDDKPRFVRAVVVSDDGELLDSSEVAKVAVVQGTDSPDVTLTGERISGAEAMTLHARGIGMGRGTRIEWETADSPAGPWGDLDGDEEDDDDEE